MKGLLALFCGVRYLFCLIMLLALMLRAVPSNAWAGRAARDIVGQETGGCKGELPADSDDFPADEQDDTEGKGSIEKEPFTNPQTMIPQPGHSFASRTAVLYFPVQDSRCHLHHPDIHTPPPDRLV